MQIKTQWQRSLCWIALAVGIGITSMPVRSAAGVRRGGPRLQTPGESAKRSVEEQLVAAAERILVGRCTGVESRWDAERRVVFTLATFDVEREIRGAGAGSVVVRSLGGTLGRITQMLVDGPRFAVNERALLFLAPDDEPGRFRVVGLREGKLGVTSDARTGADVVHTGGRFVPAVASAHATPAALPLDAVVSRIRVISAERASGR